MLNGGVTLKSFLTRSIQQGCPPSPLLFAIVTHSLLIMLSNLVSSGDTMGLHIPSGKKLVAQALADEDYFMFLTQVWNQFALVSMLHINWRKSHIL